MRKPPDYTLLAALDQRVSGHLAPLVLAARGLGPGPELERYLSPPISDIRLSPADHPAAAEAGRRIWQAIKDGRQVCVYGDYDVDGTTGSTILWRTIRRLGQKPLVYVPHRFDEGYGLNVNAGRSIQRAGYSMLVTVDCGVTAGREIRQLEAAGLEVIVTDHHEPKEDPADLPTSMIVHPKLTGWDSFESGSCGALTAMKTAAAILGAAETDGQDVDWAGWTQECLPLAAVGTVADVMSLTQENRAIVFHGLAGMTSCPVMGLGAVLDVCGIGPDDIVRAEDIGFGIGPRFNAAGRLGRAASVIELLTSEDVVECARLAAHLSHQNEHRKSIEKGIVEAAAAMAQPQADLRRPAIVVDGPWHAGVIGIVAARLVERFGCPALVSTHGHGSARSVPGFALHQALAECSSHLSRFGGHAAAAGYAVTPGKLEEFQEAFWAAAATRRPPETKRAPVIIDAEARFPHVNIREADYLNVLEPCGQGNPRPTFLFRQCYTVEAKLMGKGKDHLSVTLSQSTGPEIRCVWFSGGWAADMFRAGLVDIVGCVKKNEFAGRTTAQIEIKAVRPSRGPA